MAKHGETRLANHAGGNSLRKCLDTLRYQPGVLLCYHFSRNHGESANGVNLIMRLNEMYRDLADYRRKTERCEIIEPRFFNDPYCSRLYRLVTRTIRNILADGTYYKYFMNDILRKHFEFLHNDLLHRNY